jgi:predicted transcriptional regulator
MHEKLGLLKVTERGEERSYSMTQKGREFLADFLRLDEDASGTKRRVFLEALGIKLS